MSDYHRDLRPQGNLYSGDHLYSAARAFRLSMQKDGNLVLYGIDDQTLPLYIAKGSYKRPLWASDTVGSGATHCDMQDDGNVVLYDDAGGVHWASNTEGNPGAFLRCQDDGNLVLYSGTKSLWASDTWAGSRGGATGGDVIKPKPPDKAESEAWIPLVGAVDDPYLVWTGTFPPLGVLLPDGVVSGVLKRIDAPGIPGLSDVVKFLAPGKSCGDAAGGHIAPLSSSDDGLKHVFGSNTPALPVAIRACILAVTKNDYFDPSTGKVIPISVKVTYTAMQQQGGRERHSKSVAR